MTGPTESGPRLRLVDPTSDDGAPPSPPHGATEDALMGGALATSDAESHSAKRRMPSALAALVGSSAPMRHLRQSIQRIATLPGSVVISGETGAGKEMVARAIHELGRPGQPFVGVNCATLTDLAASTLLGHARGSFTGADRNALGLLVQTQDGTLFLDEIAELPMAAQAMLLRVVEGHAFLAVGGESPKTFQGRVLAATHAELELRVKEGRFRADLLHRLRRHILRVPALSERREDIRELVDAFRANLQPRCDFTADAIGHMAARAWGGNVRDLQNYVLDAAAHAAAGVVDVTTLRAIDGACAARALESFTGSTFAASASLGSEVEALVRDRLALALQKSNGSAKAAAKQLGMPRTTFVRRAQKYGLLRPSSKNE